MNTSLKRRWTFVFFAAVFFAAIFFIEFLVNKYECLNFGKDEGLVFRVMSQCIMGGAFFLVLKRGNILKRFFIGFFIGFVSYIIVFFIYIIIGLSGTGVKLISVIPVFGDEIIATIFFIAISFYSLNKATKYKEIDDD